MFFKWLGKEKIVKHLKPQLVDDLIDAYNLTDSNSDIYEQYRSHHNSSSGQ